MHVYIYLYLSFALNRQIQIINQIVTSTHPAAIQLHLEALPDDSDQLSICLRMEDFVHAVANLKTSVTLDELHHYENLAKQYDSNHVSNL